MLLALAAGAAGCTGDAAEPKASAADRLTAAATTIGDAPAMEIDLRTKALPSGQSGLLSAEGVGDHSPAFRGKVEVSAGGASLGAEVVAVDGKVWAKTGFAPGFGIIDPASLQAPDPAVLVGTGPTDGLPGLLTRTQDLKTGDKSRDGDEVLTDLTGSIPGADVAALLPSADASSAFDVTYRLTDDDELHDATITGPFYGDEDVTYTLEITPMNEAVTITAP